MKTGLLSETIINSSFLLLANFSGNRYSSGMTDQSMQTITTYVEKDLLNIIIENLEQNKIDTAEAKAVAKEFLSLLPLQDKKDIYEKLMKLNKDHSETKSLYLKYAQPYEEEERQRKLTLMSQHIKNGNIEGALSVAKDNDNTKLNS